MAAGLCLITTSLCAILNCSWTALGRFPRPGEEAETVQQRGHPRFYSCFHCTHAANSSLCSRLLCRGDMWSVGVYTAASRSLYFTQETQHSGKTKEGDKQPPRDQSFQRLFVMMLEPEARRDTLDFLEDGHEMGFSVHVTTRAPVDWIKC